MNKKLLTCAVLCAASVNLHAATTGSSIGQWFEQNPKTTIGLGATAGLTVGYLTSNRLNTFVPQALQNFGLTCKQWATDNPGKSFILGIGTGAIAAYLAHRAYTHFSSPQWQGLNDDIESAAYQPEVLAAELLQQDKSRVIEARRKIFILTHLYTVRLYNPRARFGNPMKPIETAIEEQLGKPIELGSPLATALRDIIHTELGDDKIMPMAYNMLSVVLNPSKSSTPDTSPTTMSIDFIDYMQEIQNMFDDPSLIPDQESPALNDPAIAYLAELKELEALQPYAYTEAYFEKNKLKQQGNRIVAAYALITFLERRNRGFAEHSISSDRLLNQFMHNGYLSMQRLPIKDAIQDIFYTKLHPYPSSPEVNQQAENVYHRQKNLVQTASNVIATLFGSQASEQAQYSLREYYIANHEYDTIYKIFGTRRAVEQYKDKTTPQKLQEAESIVTAMQNIPPSQNLPESNQINSLQHGLREILQAIRIAHTLYPVIKTFYSGDRDDVEFFATSVMQDIIASKYNKLNRDGKLNGLKTIDRLTAAKTILYTEIINLKQPSITLYLNGTYPQFPSHINQQIDKATAEANLITDETIHAATIEALERVRTEILNRIHPSSNSAASSSQGDSNE